MPLRMEVGLGPDDIVLDGDHPAPPPGKRGTSAPYFWAHVCCGQTAEWIKMPFDTEVGLGPSDIVLYGDPAHPMERGTAAKPPLLGSCVLWPNSRPSQQLLSSCGVYFVL